MRRGTIAISITLTLVVTGLFLGSHPAAQAVRAVDLSLAHFNANRLANGVSNPSAELRPRLMRVDERGVSHVRFDQIYKGVPVFEGEAITHVDTNDDVTVTDSLRGNLNVSTLAQISAAAATGTALRFINPIGAFHVRDASLWILPRGERSLFDRLVWQVVVAVENDFEDPAEWRYFVDAHTGAVAWAYNNLETTDSPATARTMYTGDRSIRADLVMAKYYLRNVFDQSGSYTCDMAHATSGTCTIFSRTTAVFGNNSKNNTDAATAGADAHFGLQATWSYYKNTFGRNGINGSGKKTYSRVHYGQNYQNAFWNNSCFCMTYGDGGSTFYPLVSVDVAGHEMSHGVMSAEANLTYSGESGGLNESNSDIFGTMVEYSVNSAQDVPDYWIGERILKSNWSNGGATYTQTKALRYMDDPHKDGSSPACWSSGLGNLDVHYSSGPNNHMFYLLAQGGTSKCNGQVVGGIGRATAQRIWYEAISNHMTSSTNYHGARAAALAAAVALGYPSSSTQYKAVAAAYSAINVN